MTIKSSLHEMHHRLWSRTHVEIRSTWTMVDDGISDGLQDRVSDSVFGNIMVYIRNRMNK